MLAKAFAGLIFAAGVVSNASFAKAAADCDPLNFVIQDFQHVITDERTSIAFLKTASKEQYDQATKGLGGSYGSITGHYDEDKKSAEREASLSKFNYDRSFYVEYLSQQLSPYAVQMYSECLAKDKESPGLRIWLQKRQGDYFTLGAFWVGSNAEAGSADVDADPIADNLTIVQLPHSWTKGNTQQIVVKRNPKIDGFFGLSIGHQTGSFVVLRDPEIIPILSHVIKSAKLMQASRTYVNGHTCPSGQDTDCLSPTMPGGSLVVGSGTVTDFTATQADHSSATVIKDTPEQICFKIIASTGACEAGNSVTARGTAVERYPAALTKETP